MGLVCDQYKLKCLLDKTHISRILHKLHCHYRSQDLNEAQHISANLKRWINMGWFEESHSQWVNGWNGRSSALHSIQLYIQHPLVIRLAWNYLERTYDTSWEEIMLSIRSIAQKAGGIHTVLRISGDASEHRHEDHRIDTLCWSLSNISQVLSGSIYKHSRYILFSMEETLHFMCGISPDLLHLFHHKMLDEIWDILAHFLSVYPERMPWQSH